LGFLEGGIAVWKENDYLIDGAKSITPEEFWKIYKKN
jgi:hypothetical protein